MISSLDVWVDQAAGVREEAMFFGPDRLKMFGCLRTPEGAPRGAVLICPPLHEDFIRTYRKGVLLARSLASHGFAVLGFNYRGTGNSHGETHDITFEGMLEDALAAAGWLEQRTGTNVVALVGTRWGGLIAAAAARMLADAPLALWEPPVDQAAYFREASKARMAWEMREGIGDGRTFAQELAANGWVDVLGYPVHEALYESTRGRSLLEEIGERPRPILLVQMTRSRRLQDGYAAVAQELRRKGFEIQVETLVGEESWWFTGDRWQPEEIRPGTGQLMRTTTDWVVGSVAGRAS